MPSQPNENEADPTDDDDNDNETLSSDAKVTSFPCTLCSATFAFQSLLNHHRTTDHEVKRFPCVIDFCDQVFESRGDLERHERGGHTATPALLAAHSSASDPNDVACIHIGCGLVFASQHLLRRHQSIHRLQSYRCTACGRQYHSEGVYQTHVRLCQPITDDVVLVADDDIDSGPVLCRVCNQLFENRKILKFHRKFCADEEAEEEEKRRGIALRESCGISTANGSTVGEQSIEEVYVKEEIDEEANGNN